SNPPATLVAVVPILPSRGAFPRITSASDFILSPITGAASFAFFAAVAPNSRALTDILATAPPVLSPYSWRRRSISCSACSRVYPYLSCIKPTSLSFSPPILSKSSSVSLPHHVLRSPRICCHFPARMSWFMGFVSILFSICELPPCTLNLGSCELHLRQRRVGTASCAS